MINCKGREARKETKKNWLSELVWGFVGATLVVALNWAGIRPRPYPTIHQRTQKLCASAVRFFNRHA